MDDQQRKGEVDPARIRRASSAGRKILSMYGPGMKTRAIQRNSQEMYGVDVGRTLISNVTDAVAEEGKEWQRRPLETKYGLLRPAAVARRFDENLGLSFHAHHVPRRLNTPDWRRITSADFVGVACERRILDRKS